MFIHPTTMCLMLLTIQNYIGINKMTGGVANAFAVKHPSNQAFTNEGMRTSCPWATVRTQLEYTNDVEKYNDYADDNDVDFDENEKRWMEKIYQIKSSTANDQPEIRQPPLIEKRSKRWTDYYFKASHSDVNHVHVHCFFFSANPKNAFTIDPRYNKKFIENFWPKFYSITLNLPVNYENDKRNFGAAVTELINQSSLSSSSKLVLHNRKIRDTHLYDSIPIKGKLTSGGIFDDSISLIPAPKVDRELLKLFTKSLRQDESLTNINTENSMSTVKINSPSMPIVETIQREVKQKPHQKSSNSGLQQKQIKLGNDDIASMNIPAVIQSTNGPLRITKFIDSIQSINTRNIPHSHKVFTTTTPIFKLNFHKVHPRHFVLAPTKFVDNIKIFPASFEFINFDQSNIVKGMVNKEKDVKFNFENDAIMKKDKTDEISPSDSSSNIDPIQHVTSIFKQDMSNELLRDIHVTHDDSKIHNIKCQENSVGKIQLKNSQTFSHKQKYDPNISTINYEEINHNEQLNSQLNNPRYAGNYDFEYRVADDSARNYFGHRESRSEGVTNGQYHVLLPDGRIQEVKYRVDKSGGYRANVTYHNQVYG